MAEMLFFQISANWPRPKACFYHFLRIGHGRKHVFIIFCKLAMAESVFLSFSVNWPRPKACFYHFLQIGYGRKRVFIIFCELAMAESMFLSFSANWPRRMSKKHQKQRFRLCFSHCRGAKKMLRNGFQLLGSRKIVD